MFKFSAQPKTILRNNKPLPTQSKTPENKQSFPKAKQHIYIPIGEDLLPEKHQKLADPNEYFTCDRPQAPAYVPLPSKINKGTQILHKDWLLFNFDKEVEPVLEVLMAEVLKASKNEVREENELAYKKDKLYSIKRVRNGAYMKTKHLMNHEERVQREISSRRKQCVLKQQVLFQAQKKALAANFAKFTLLPKIFTFAVQSLDCKQLCRINEADAIEVSFGNELLLQKTTQVSLAGAGHSEFSRRLENEVRVKIEKTHQQKMMEHSVQIAEQISAEAFAQEEHKIRLKENQRARFLIAENERKGQIERFFKSSVLAKFELIKEKEFLNSNFLSIADFISQVDYQKSYVGFIFEPLVYIATIIHSLSAENFESKLRKFIVEFLKLNAKNLSFYVSEEFFTFVENSCQKKMIGEEINAEEIAQATSKEAEEFSHSRNYPGQLIDSHRAITLLSVLFSLKLEGAEKVAKSHKQSNSTTPEGTQLSNELAKNSVLGNSNLDQEKFLRPERINFVSLGKNDQTKKDKNFYLGRINFAFSGQPKAENADHLIEELRQAKRFYQFDGSLFEKRLEVFDIDYSPRPVKTFSSQGHNLFMLNRIGFHTFLLAIKEVVEKTEGIAFDLEKQISIIDLLEKEYLLDLRRQFRQEFLVFDFDD